MLPVCRWTVCCVLEYCTSTLKFSSMKGKKRSKNTAPLLRRKKFLTLLTEKSLIIQASTVCSPCGGDFVSSSPKVRYPQSSNLRAFLRKANSMHFLFPKNQTDVRFECSRGFYSILLLADLKTREYWRS